MRLPTCLSALSLPLLLQLAARPVQAGPLPSPPPSPPPPGGTEVPATDGAVVPSESDVAGLEMLLRAIQKKYPDIFKEGKPNSKGIKVVVLDIPFTDLERES